MALQRSPHISAENFILHNSPSPLKASLDLASDFLSRFRWHFTLMLPRRHLTDQPLKLYISTIFLKSMFGRVFVFPLKLGDGVKSSRSANLRASPEVHLKRSRPRALTGNGPEQPRVVKRLGWLNPTAPIRKCVYSRCHSCYRARWSRVESVLATNPESTQPDESEETWQIKKYKLV